MRGTNVTYKVRSFLEASAGRAQRTPSHPVITGRHALPRPEKRRFSLSLPPAGSPSSSKVGGVGRLPGTLRVLRPMSLSEALSLRRGATATFAAVDAERRR